MSPDAVDLGEDVTAHVAVAHPPGVVLAVRLTGDERAGLERCARRAGLSWTAAAHAALAAWIAQSDATEAAS